MSLLEVSNLGMSLPAGDGKRPILHNVNLAIGRGEAVAVVGESGSGKSMTARTIARLQPPEADVWGEVRFDGKDVLSLTNHELRSLRSDQIGVVFQDSRAHINPVHSVGDFLVEPLVRNRGMNVGQAKQRVVSLLDDVGVSRPGERLDQYPHELSGGLLQRVMIASVLAMEPKLILADEPTTALDVTTQADVMGILDDLRKDSQTALLLITHDLELAAAICDRTVVMYAGWTLESATSNRLHQDPLHPYTEALVSSRPDIDRRVDRLPAIPGRPLSAVEAPSGCPFAPRCAHQKKMCREIVPVLREVDDGRGTACIRVEELYGSRIVREVGEYG